MPAFVVEDGAELEGWNKFVRRFELAALGAGLKHKEALGAKSKRRSEEEEAERFNIEQRKAALLLDSMGEYGMEIFETWDFEIDTLQFQELKKAFEEHFAGKENIYATRHRFLGLTQMNEEKLDRFIERVERSGKICRFRGLEEEMNIQIIIKGMHVEKIRTDLLLEKELSLEKVKAICNRYETAMAAKQIITSSHSKHISEVDQVEEGREDTRPRQEDVNIDRVGFGGYYRYGDRGRGSSFRGRTAGRGRGCWTCGGFGHDYRACKEKADRGRLGRKDGGFQCFVCGESSHMAKNCPKGYRSKEGGRGKINAIAGQWSDSDQESL